MQPETYFDQLPAVMKEVPPLSGEEALYANIQNVLDAASKDPKLHAALVASAVEADKNLVDPLFQFHNYGIPLPNNWTTQTNGASVAGCYIDLDARIWFSQTITQCALAWFRRYPARVPSIWGFVDSDGTPLSGGSNYHLHLPPKIPAANFWSLTAYEAENASGLASSQAFPSLGLRDKPAQNPDGSMELYIGPKAPAGKESNWLATVPGRGYFTIFRLYGPTETAIDKSWKPGDLEKDK